MKVRLPYFLLAVAYTSIETVAEDSHDDACTYGKLYLVDSASMRMVSIDLDDAVDSFVVTEMPDMDLEGTPPLYLEKVAGTLVLTAAYWGSEEKSMTDGVVNMIHTGVGVQGDVVTSDEPFKIVNAPIYCGPVYHIVSSQGLLAVQCEGFTPYNDTTSYSPVNGSTMVFDESKFSGSDDADTALVTEYSLIGSHHGSAQPLDDGIILQSLPSEDVIMGVPNASSLPNTYEVVNYNGEVLHQLTNTSDPNESCFGNHGFANAKHSYYYACDRKNHGGVLKFDYDEDTQGFSSNSIKYPNHPDMPNHRASGIVTHKDSPYIVTDFADWSADVWAPQLLAFEATASQASTDGVLELGAVGQCDFGFEQAHGEWIVVLLPDPKVQVYKVGANWTLMAEETIPGEPWAECPWPVPFTVGYMQAFVYVNETLYILDLKNVEEDGAISTTTMELDFIPYHIKVAGVPDGYACDGSESHLEGPTAAPSSPSSEGAEDPEAEDSEDAVAEDSEDTVAEDSEDTEAVETEGAASSSDEDASTDTEAVSSDDEATSFDAEAASSASLTRMPCIILYSCVTALSMLAATIMT